MINLIHKSFLLLKNLGYVLQSKICIYPPDLTFKEPRHLQRASKVNMSAWWWGSLFGTTLTRLKDFYTVINDLRWFRQFYFFKVFWHKRQVDISLISWQINVLLWMTIDCLQLFEPTIQLRHLQIQKDIQFMVFSS